MGFSTKRHEDFHGQAHSAPDNPETDTVEVLQQFFAVSGFSITEDDILGDAVFTHHATLVNEISNKCVLIHVLAPSYGINSFLFRQPLSILMSTIFPMEYVSCFPDLLRQRLALTARGNIAVKWGRRWENTGLTVRYLALSTPSKSGLDDFIKTLTIAEDWFCKGY
jgi:hypothetical protein